jgi:hypothetical protein
LEYKYDRILRVPRDRITVKTPVMAGTGVIELKVGYEPWWTSVIPLILRGASVSAMRKTNAHSKILHIM